VLVAGVVALALAPVATGATIEVRPGSNAINKALAKAHNGDTLRIHDGTYKETFNVDKRVTLRGVGGRPLIDGQCNARRTTMVRSGGVTFDHLKIVGAAEGFGLYPSEVDVENIGSGTIHDVIVHDTCGGPADGAEYGINVFDSGPVQVTGNRAAGGFSDAGIYIGQITDTGSGTLRVLDNETFLNHQGIIIENSAGGRIQVAHNEVHDNKTAGVETEEASGIFIHHSDGVAIRSNSVESNGDIGVNIDADSDHNRLINNLITNNPLDVNNQGTSNCGSGNNIGTKAGNPLPPCG
jgi:parallel beta-helix repeat protein